MGAWGRSYRCWYSCVIAELESQSLALMEEVSQLGVGLKGSKAHT